MNIVHALHLFVMQRSRAFACTYLGCTAYETHTEKICWWNVQIKFKVLRLDDYKLALGQKSERWRGCHVHEYLVYACHCVPV